MSWNIVHYGVKRDRDENAARNILVAGGHAETKNGQVGQYNPDSPLLNIKLISFTNL